MVVDDESISRTAIKKALENYRVSFPFCDDDFSYKVIESATGEQAVEILKNSRVDIVLLENDLPGIDGITVVDFIRQNHIDAAVMMITSNASMELAVRATNSGAFNFVTKPFTGTDLRSAVESITKHLFLKRMTRKMKVEARQVRYRFLSVLSHELKSPINAIEGYLRIMQDRQAGNDISQYEQMIDRSLTRIESMRGLIMDMLDLTRIESNSRTRTLKKTNLVEIANMAIDSIRPVAIQMNVEIVAELPGQLYFLADATEIEIIFNNLLSNAVKYNRENGRVIFRLAGKERNIACTVEDTGIGMTDEERVMLFKEFSRIKNPHTRHITGSGLGLSITKRIVDIYNGTIEVQSTPDVGSVFTLELKTL